MTRILSAALVMCTSLAAQTVPVAVAGGGPVTLTGGGSPTTVQVSCGGAVTATANNSGGGTLVLAIEGATLDIKVNETGRTSRIYRADADGSEWIRWDHPELGVIKVRVRLVFWFRQPPPQIRVDIDAGSWGSGAGKWQ